MATFTIDVPAGPLFNQEDAEAKCPQACAAHLGEWNGQWTTVVEGEMSVCGCVVAVDGGGNAEFTIDIPAGPLWNQADAEQKAPIACASYGGTWNGQWRTVVEGRMSVAGCTFKI